MNHVIKSFHAGDVVCDIGQIDNETRRELIRLLRKGKARKWRGHWFPVAGANYGIGPLKTCWQRVDSDDC